MPLSTWIETWVIVSVAVTLVWVIVFKKVEENNE